MSAVMQRLAELPFSDKPANFGISADEYAAMERHIIDTEGRIITEPVSLDADRAQERSAQALEAALIGPST